MRSGRRRRPENIVGAYRKRAHRTGNTAAERATEMGSEPHYVNSPPAGSDAGFGVPSMKLGSDPNYVVRSARLTAARRNPLPLAEKPFLAAGAMGIVALPIKRKTPDPEATHAICPISP